MLNLVLSNTDFTKFSKWQEQRDHLLGRVFGIMAILRSNVLANKNVEPAEVEAILVPLLDCLKSKQTIRELATEAILLLIGHLPVTADYESMIQTKLIPVLKNSQDNAESVSLLLKLQEKFSVGDLVSLWLVLTKLTDSTRAGTGPSIARHGTD